MPISSSQLLNSLEWCAKQAQLIQSLEREALSPHQLLYRGVEHGIQIDSDDPAQAASDEVMRLALSRPIDTQESDLLGLAEHLSALAEIIVWCLRTGPAWTHPDPLPDWSPSSWTICGGLRRIVLCDSWSERRALQEVHDWRTMEGAIYGLPMTIIAVVLGPMRDGRRHGPLTKGYLHPRSGELRFRKRDSTPFEGWESVWRERFPGSREDWIAAMNADGVMTETFQIHPEIVWSAEDAATIRDLAHRKLSRENKNPDRSLSRCFDSLRPCEFRFPCSFFSEPEEGKGFVRIAESTTATADPSSAHRELLRQK